MSSNSCDASGGGTNTKTILIENWIPIVRMHIENWQIEFEKAKRWTNEMRWTNVLRLINYFEFCLFSLWVVRWVDSDGFLWEPSARSKHEHKTLSLHCVHRLQFSYFNSLNGINWHEKKGQTGRHVTVFLSIFFSQIDKSQTNERANEKKCYAIAQRSNVQIATFSQTHDND